MKNAIRLLIFFSFIITTPALLNAQTLVNRQFVATLGHPTLQFPFINGASDGSNFVLVENQYITGQPSGFKIGKLDGSGNFVWTNQFSTTDNDYATDLFINNDGYIYVTGFNWDSATSRAVFNMVKFREDNGDTVFSRQYHGSYGGYDAAAVIMADDTGNIFVAGTEQVGSLDYEMTL
ncbi:MAG: repeat containing protein, partial [Bacteroidota bacterium]|nr:repeat containing protein [Bacteroidota bacterium]